jgi:hypothetical protein
VQSLRNLVFEQVCQAGKSTRATMARNVPIPAAVDDRVDQLLYLAAMLNPDLPKLPAVTDLALRTQSGLLSKMLTEEMIGWIEKGWSWKEEHKTYQRLLQIALVLHSTPAATPKRERLVQHFKDLIDGELLVAGSASPWQTAQMMWGAQLKDGLSAEESARVIRLLVVMQTYLEMKPASGSVARASDWIRIMAERISREDFANSDPRLLYFALQALRRVADRGDWPVLQRAEATIYRRFVVLGDSQAEAPPWVDLLILEALAEDLVEAGDDGRCPSGK